MTVAELALKEASDLAVTTAGPDSRQQAFKALDAGRSCGLTAGIAIDGVTPENALPAAYLAETLESAEQLLGYAAEIGVDIEVDVRHAILKARGMGNGNWNEQTANDLLASLTKLAAKLKPLLQKRLRHAKRRRARQFVATGEWQSFLP